MYPFELRHSAFVNMKCENILKFEGFYTLFILDNNWKFRHNIHVLESFENQKSQNRYLHLVLCEDIHTFLVITINLASLYMFFQASTIMLCFLFINNRYLIDGGLQQYHIKCL